MLGAIIGDIVGSRFEFNNTNKIDFELFTKDSNYTDDTICTIAVADAILKNIPFAYSIQHWCRKYPHPMGGYGGSFGRWVFSDNPQPYNSFGNGSAMRVSPCSWISDDFHKVFRLAEESAKCTHDHPEGIKGAVAVADCIYKVRNGYSKQKLKEYISCTYGYDLNQSCDEIRAKNSFNETCQVTVPQSIICYLESNSFEQAIRLAVSIWGDSDTIGAITGSIAEAGYGIPKSMLATVDRLLPADMKNVIFEFNKKYKR
ncbi:MAG: ADP-ribosylglycohydrolase family protein [Bacteroidales bacterium]